MKTKKLLRSLALLFFIIMASIIPFPINFHKRDNLPTYEIEQIDKKDEEEDNEKQEYRL